MKNLGRYEEAVASYDKSLEIEPDDDEAWYNRGYVLEKLERYEEALTSYDNSLEFKPDQNAAWNNRGNALGNLGRYEEAVASYDNSLEIKPDNEAAWIGRGNAAGKSVSCDPHLSLHSIARQHFELYQRGYKGKLASYEQGLKHCLQDTHPEGWGKLHQAIGDTYCCRCNSHSCPSRDLPQSVKSYKEALKTLTAEAFPEAHLEVLQNLIRVYSDLGEKEKVQALLAKGTVLLENLLQVTPSDFNKIRLSRKFASFAQFYVDELVQKGKFCEALEFAEQRKNVCLTWLYGRWSKSTDSPNYAQMQQLLQPSLLVLPTVKFFRGKDGQIYVTLPKVNRQSVGAKAIIYWHISPAAITTFILRHNQPPIIVGAKNGGTDKPLSIALNSGRSPQPPSQGGLRVMTLFSL